MKRVVWLSVVWLLVVTGCSSSSDGGMEPSDSPGPGSQAGSSGADSGNNAGSDAGNGSAGNSTGGPGSSAGTSGSSTDPGSNGSAGSGNGSSGSSGSSGTPPAADEELDPGVDWEALTLVPPAIYSAHDGVHTFQVPIRVDGVTVALSDWQAIPASAATFDPDPEGGGVMITVQEAVEEITIAARSGPIGGTAILRVTAAGENDWETGRARYNNGVDYELPMLDFAQLIDPNWMPPPTPTDLACNNCHTTGAKYFEIQHTPTQIGGLSDEALTTIFTTGMKPPGAPFTLLPPSFQHLYVQFHTWEATEEEQRGLIVFLRALTPTAQGEIALPF